MKHIVFFSIISFLFFQNCSNAQVKSEKTNSEKEKLSIYYFHALKRCPTCISIEENTRKVLDLYFTKEVEAGEIKLYVLCYEDSKNKTLVEKYGAYGATLILQNNTGKEKMEDLTNFAFQYSRNNPDKFISGLKEKISLVLK